jgi:hypothetical protein
MPIRTFLTILAAASLLSGSLGACLAGVVLKTSDRDYPKTNAHPQHLILLTGKISPTLHLTLAARYQADRRPHCERSPNFVSGFFEGAFFPAVVNVPLTVKFDKGVFQATVVEDQFLPGQCNWHLHAVGAQLSKNGVTSPGDILVQPNDDRNFDRNVLRWVSTGSVIWRCRFSLLSNLPKGQSAIACGRRQNSLPGDRPFAILQPSMRSLEVSFIDLEASAAYGTGFAGH